jgi:uncharacterized cupredoxin-like copper-binding protein
MTFMRKLRGLPGVLLSVAVAVALVACGSGGTGGDEFSTEVVLQQVEVGANPSGALAWDRAEYRVQAGDVTFVVKNPSPLAHQFAVEGNGASYQSPHLKAGTTNRFTIMGLQPGRYRIVCNYPGHKAAGMVATLIVE